MEFACARGDVEQGQIDRMGKKFVFPYESLQDLPEGTYTDSMNVFFFLPSDKKIRYISLSNMIKSRVLSRIGDGVSYSLTSLKLSPFYVHLSFYILNMYYFVP